MDYKEKYDEALERAKSAIKDCGDNKGRISMIESIFPELKESEDERIRKRLIEFFEEWGETKSHCWGKSVNKILAWLEKQGEKKPTWSEGDERMLNELILGFYAYKELYPNFWKLRTDEIIEWLKSLKERLS